MNRFERLAAIDCRDHIEHKNGLSYLSWAWAWDAFKRVFPESYFTIYERPDGCIYWTDGKTCWVKTGVTLVDGDFRLEHIEYLPVMDFRNASIPAERITSTDANKSIQRSLTKAVARHGLGLYIYAGEDLPVDAEEDEKPAKPAKPVKPAKASVSTVDTSSSMICPDCGKPITPYMKDGAVIYTAEQIADMNQKRFGMRLCSACSLKRRNAS